MQKLPFYRGIYREISILQGFWWRNWQFNGALEQKFPLYRGISREISILQEFGWRYWHFTWIVLENLAF